MIESTLTDCCHPKVVLFQLNRNRKLLLSAVGLFTFDWDKERVRLDETVHEFFNEFERIECLKSKASYTSEGAEQLKPECVDANNRNPQYRLNDLDSWEFYVQKDSMITWRREEEPGHYAYKGEKLMMQSKLLTSIAFTYSLR